MNTKSDAKNQVWVGTFQLVWNDLIDEIIHHPVEFVDGKSVDAENLNKREFTSDDLKEESYYKKFGLVSKELKKEIGSAIKEKFNETSDILVGLDWTPAPEKYLLHAMIKEDFEYIVPFEKMSDAPFQGSNGDVKYFGIKDRSNVKLMRSGTGLFYNSKDDFAVTLKSKQGDTVYLFRTNDERLEGASTICGGGRYNNLVKNLDGPDLAGVGFAIGYERLASIVKSLDLIDTSETLDIYIAPIDIKNISDALIIGTDLRDAGFKCEIDYRDTNFKNKMSTASKMNASFAVIIGEEELKDYSVILKDLKTKEEKKISINNLADELYINF